MRPSLSLAHRWKFHSVEWNPKVAAVQAQLPESTNFVLPDLPRIYRQEDRDDYMFQVSRPNRILTIAASHHTPESLLSESTSFDTDRLLLVGGNEKSKNSLSTVDAARILNDSLNGELDIWGVTNPNDPNSLENVLEKVDAGITGFITQPLLSSQALDNFESYPRPSDGSTSQHISYVAGMAMPRSAKNLQFWLTLLDQPELENDPLFKAHLAFFSQPYFTSAAWLDREIENLSTRATMDGIHFMPLGNIQDLLTTIPRLGL
eukprot:scaffold26115_cov132-Cylindrotheca_fusiformis.AAC.2